MAEAIRERASCEKCGADIRENTQYCYNCGTNFVEATPAANGLPSAARSDEQRTALDDLAARLRTDEAEREDKLASAAAKRKKARIAPKKAPALIWEADDTRSGLFIFFIAVLIFLLVSAVVFFTVYWK